MKGNKAKREKPMDNNNEVSRGRRVQKQASNVKYFNEPVGKVVLFYACEKI